MTEDPNIATFASANCAPGAAGDETSYRTEDPVPAESLDKVFDATFKADVGPKGSGFAGAVQSGQWYDDGDGAAEDPGLVGRRLRVHRLRDDGPFDQGVRRPGAEPVTCGRNRA